jgi:phospholipase C
MALSADGNTAVIGGNGDNNSQGAVWVFTRSEDSNGVGVWNQQGPKLTAGDLAVGSASFGISVALSWDGDTLLVGGIMDNNNAGAAWVFTRSNGVWTGHTKLTAAAPAPLLFGMSVALSMDGNIALVGANGSGGPGAAWVFTRTDGVWNARGTMLAGDNTVNSFGKSVALSANGDVALIGASGAGSAAGTAYVFASVDGNWHLTGAVPLPNDPGGSQGFGYSVDLSADGNVALIGSAGNGLNATQCGAWVYLNVGGDWKQLGSKLIAGTSAAFGQVVSLSADGQIALIGDFDTTVGGVGWVFTSQDGVWTQQGPRLAGVPGGFVIFSSGYSVAVSPDGYTFMICGFDQNTDGPAWVFDNDSEVISRVFVLMLENHSFDNMFAFSGINGIISKAAGNSNSYQGTTYDVSHPAPAAMHTDPGHEFADVWEQLCGPDVLYVNGKPYPTTLTNSGFVSNYATSITELHSGNPVLPTPAQFGDIMKCFNTQSQLPVIYQLATEFALCDQWFSSLPGPTFPNRAFLHGGSSSGFADSPSSAQSIAWASPGEGFAHANGNIFLRLNDRGVVWRVYIDPSANLFGWLPPPVCLLKGVQYVHNTSDFPKFLIDVKDPNYPEGYTFIEPNYGDAFSESFKPGSSQHPLDDVYGGEMLIKKTYEAIRNSPHWNNCVLIILYDEHGGFYDSIAPGAAPPPNDTALYTGTTKFNFEQFGVRVPAIVVSPRVVKGFVDHTLYDHTSVLATLEEIFGLPFLTDRDQKANNLHALLTGPVRTDCSKTLPDPVPPLTAQVAPEFVSLAESQQPLPEKGNVHGFLAIVLKTDLEMTDSKAERAAIIANFKTIKTRAEARAYAMQVGERAEKARALRGNRITPLPSPGGGGVSPVDALTCPAGFPIKGNTQKSTGRKLYHMPGEGSYNRTKPEVCFATRADAEAAGYVYSRR